MKKCKKKKGEKCYSEHHELLGLVQEQDIFDILHDFVT